LEEDHWAVLRFTFHVLTFTVLASNARTPLGKRRVTARQGRAGEKGDFFSILNRGVNDHGRAGSISARRPEEGRRWKKEAEV
jgi:hypothetical protein